MRDEEKSWKPAQPLVERVGPTWAAYRRRQAEAEQKAEQAPSDAERDAWCKIADGWRRLAEPPCR